LSDKSFIQTVLKQGDILPPLLFILLQNISLRRRRKPSGPYQVLAYVDVMNLLGVNIDAI
jgi:hypothetical protein